MLYALREALRLCEQETLEASFERHELNHRAFVAGIEAMGLSMHVRPGKRLWILNAPVLPDGCDDALLRKPLLEDFGIEVLGGFRRLADKTLRVGLVGASSARRYVRVLPAALETRLGLNDGLRAAEAVYSS